jgi:hypothetical protein
VEVVFKQSRFSSAAFFLPYTRIGPLPAEAIGLHEPSRELLLCLLFVGPAFSLFLLRADEINRTRFLHEIASSRFRNSSCEWTNGERYGTAALSGDSRSGTEIIIQRRLKMSMLRALSSDQRFGECGSSGFRLKSVGNAKPGDKFLRIPRQSFSVHLTK